MADTITGEPTRRDFLFVATGAMGVVAAGAAVWPLIDQMNPDASVAALASIEVDVSAMEVGQAITVKWRGKPVFIRRRSPEEIAEAKAVELGDLPDGDAGNDTFNFGSPADVISGILGMVQVNGGSNLATPDSTASVTAKGNTVSVTLPLGDTLNINDQGYGVAAQYNLDDGMLDRDGSVAPTMFATIARPMHHTIGHAY